MVLCDATRAAASGQRGATPIWHVERRANLVRKYMRDSVCNDDIRDATRAAIQRELVDLKIMR